MKQKALLAPSILSADFGRLADEVATVQQAGAEWLHVDVMDGHFVPNLTIGPPVVKSLRPLTQMTLDCHLMVARPEDWVESFAKAGADIITIHIEAAPHVNRQLERIRELGCKAGISLNPGTPVSALEEVLDYVDLVLVMSVNPGFGGQKFIDGALAKIEHLAKVRGDRRYLIEVDGGIGADNIAQVRKAGADVFVAGNAIFGQKDRKKAVAELRAAMGGKS